MLSKKMEKALNEQINAEMYSGYLYLSMSAYFEEINLPGFANWTKVQAQEEMTHAMKIYNYVVDRSGRVNLMPIDGPETEWKDTIEVMEQVKSHEEKVTGLINNLVNLAREEKDHATDNMLQWFVAEQVEEEANADEILQQVKYIDGRGHGMLMIDRELRSRVFADETQEAE